MYECEKKVKLAKNICIHKHTDRCNQCKWFATFNDIALFASAWFGRPISDNFVSVSVYARIVFFSAIHFHFHAIFFSLVFRDFQDNLVSSLAGAFFLLSRSKFHVYLYKVKCCTDWQWVVEKFRFHLNNWAGQQMKATSNTVNNTVISTIFCTYNNKIARLPILDLKIRRHETEFGERKSEKEITKRNNNFSHNIYERQWRKA